LAQQEARLSKLALLMVYSMHILAIMAFYHTPIDVPICGLVKIFTLGETQVGSLKWNPSHRVRERKNTVIIDDGIVALSLKRVSKIPLARTSSPPIL